MTMHNPPHPGEVLRDDVLPALDLSVTAAARELGVTRAFRPRWPCASNAGWVWNVADAPKSGRECSSTTIFGVRATARQRSVGRVQVNRPPSIT